jgi:Peptidase S8 pro-domain
LNKIENPSANCDCREEKKNQAQQGHNSQEEAWSNDLQNHRVYSTSLTHQRQRHKANCTMSNDVVRWTTKLCEHVDESRQRAKYPPPTPTVSPTPARSICDKTCEEKIKCKNNSGQHRNVDNDVDDDDDESFPMRRKNVKIFVSNFLMKSICNRLVFLYILVNLCNLIESVYSDDLLNTPGARGHFTQQWAVHIPGGNEAADRVAAEHGFINLGKVSS